MEGDTPDEEYTAAVAAIIEESPMRVLKAIIASLAGLTLLAAASAAHDGGDTPHGVKPAAVKPLAKNDDLAVTGAGVTYREELDLLVFEMKVKGRAGGTVPPARGGLDGAPVLTYAFATTLKPQDVGFSAAEGTLALAVTSHPDSDDTPLWDENNDGNYDNDGPPWHAHWVVLVPDKRVPGGLSVREFRKADTAVVLPPTSTGRAMGMYMDSPGFSTITRGNVLRVLVPAQRVNNKRARDAHWLLPDAHSGCPRRPQRQRVRRLNGASRVPGHH